MSSALVDALMELAVQPTEQEIRVFNRAVQRSRELGLQFSPGEVEVRWYCKYRDRPAFIGLTYDQRPVLVWIESALSPEEAFRTACHELQHAHDLIHLPAYRTMTRVERERRAEAFAARACEAEYGRRGTRGVRCLP
ncbi:MAG: hypothetical protein ACREMB_02620 [Candidatus Rokuibacteriota bacterium]